MDSTSTSSILVRRVLVATPILAVVLEVLLRIYIFISSNNPGDDGEALAVVVAPNQHPPDWRLPFQDLFDNGPGSLYQIAGILNLFDIGSFSLLQIAGIVVIRLVLLPCLMALIMAVTLGPPLLSILWHYLLVPFVNKIRTSWLWLLATLFLLCVGEGGVFFVLIVWGGMVSAILLEFLGFMHVIQNFALHVNRISWCLSVYLALLVWQVWHNRIDGTGESWTIGISRQLLTSQIVGAVVVILSLLEGLGLLYFFIYGCQDARQQISQSEATMATTATNANATTRDGYHQAASNKSNDHHKVVDARRRASEAAERRAAAEKTD
eukprot:CAMPEP_0198141588 /NCGR_PEP_ID=MMETSP1443-20131203/4572_1 /TAXON_ID=186043 /ORGANISM="Entomoneis sp., Strain CCMP2396" /LENGTH=322 /DNA_ID=CAMNT_0043804385 /DNA_START=178 /DNA_END=1146 /DNA_ORIENTATION=+